MRKVANAIEGSVGINCQAEISESRPKRVLYRGAPANRYPSGAFRRLRSWRKAVRIRSESSRIAFPAIRWPGRTNDETDEFVPAETE